MSSDRLNPSQAAAVEHHLGPLLVLAGAGSGKTRVVTQRIARLLERGVHPQHLLAVTFTNKAAEEMLDRVARLVGAKAAAQLTISTFHSFGLHVLGKETHALGFHGTDFAIFDQADVAGVLRELLRRIDANGRRFDLGAIMARISRAKNHFWDDHQIVEREGDDYDEIAKLLLPRYRAAMRGFQAFDFDDLVCEPVRLFRHKPEVLERWRQRYRFLLVDEYQDTNHAQLELVRLLGGEHRNVCVVGDDDQSIYAWRGADVTNILDFERHFPGATVVKLEENYRSVASVLHVANAVLARSTARRHGKVLRPVREPGAKVQHVACADPEVEADFVVREIQRLRDEGHALKELAILYRSNLQSEPFESALKERGVPFKLVGGTQFYDRKEVKDLLAYLAVVLHPRDEISLRRVLNYPARGIGEAALARLEQHALARGVTLWDAIGRARGIEGLASVAQDGCEALVAVIDHARANLGHVPAARLARELADSVRLKEDVLAGSASGQVAERRWGNVEALFATLARHDARHPQPSAEKLAELLRLLALRQDDDEQKAGDHAVLLTTMHGAKGLEFETVFLAGLEEGLMPHARTLDPKATDLGGKEAADIEEERRLFYVAVTRARDRLYLCRCKHRVLRGKPAPRTPSRFVLELPAELVEAREVEASPVMAAQKGVAKIDALFAALDADGPVARPGARPAPRRR